MRERQKKKKGRTWAEAAKTVLCLSLTVFTTAPFVVVVFFSCTLPLVTTVDEFMTRRLTTKCSVTPMRPRPVLTVENCFHVK